MSRLTKEIDQIILREIECCPLGEGQACTFDNNYADSCASCKAERIRIVVLTHLASLAPKEALLTDEEISKSYASAPVVYRSCQLKDVAKAQLAKVWPIAEAQIEAARVEERKKTHQETIDAMNDYVKGKISFERCAEIMDMNFYELAEFCRSRK